MHLRPWLLNMSGGRGRSLRVAGRVAGLAASSALGLALMGPAVAAPLVVNGSFESPVVPPNTFVTYTAPSTALTGWTISSGSVDQQGAGFWQAADGVQNIDLSGNDPGTIFQDITMPAGLFNLSYALSGNPAGPPAIKTMNVFFNPVGAPNTLIEAATYDTATQGNTFADMKYQQHTDLTQTVAGTYRLEFQSTTPGGFGPVLDNVQLNSTVPEPSSLAMMGAGAFALMAFRRRKAKKA